MVQFPMAYVGSSSLANKNGSVMPPQLEMAIMPPVAGAVAVLPDAVAVRWATNGKTAALVQAMTQTAK